MSRRLGPDATLFFIGGKQVHQGRGLGVKPWIPALHLPHRMGSKIHKSAGGFPFEIAAGIQLFFRSGEHEHGQKIPAAIAFTKGGDEAVEQLHQAQIADLPRTRCMRFKA